MSIGWYSTSLTFSVIMKMFFFLSQAYEEIHQQNIQRGNSRQIPFAVNNSQSEEFHTCFLENEDQITVSFEIENQHQQNFVAMDDDDRREFVSYFQI